MKAEVTRVTRCDRRQLCGTYHLGICNGGCIMTFKSKQLLYSVKREQRTGNEKDTDTNDLISRLRVLDGHATNYRMQRFEQRHNSRAF